MRGDQRHRFGGGVDHVGEGAWIVFAHQLFELGIGLLDRIEVWRVAGQGQQMTASGFDRRFGVGALMDGEVVEDHRLTGAQRWHEELIDERIEDRSIERAIVGKRGPSHPVEGERADEGHRLPPTSQNPSDRASSARSTRVERGQGRWGAGFVEKDQLGGIELGDRRSPSCPLCLILLAGNQRPFFRVIPRRCSRRQIVDWLTWTPT